MTMFLIRTDGGWWRPNAAGYTNEIRDAGRYSQEDAEAHIKGLGPEKMARIFPAPIDPPRWVVVRRHSAGISLYDCECIGPFVAPDIAREFGEKQFRETGKVWMVVEVQAPPQGTPAPHILWE